VAQRYRYGRIKFLVGIGGIADMNGRVASFTPVENDPERSLQLRRSIGHPRPPEREERLLATWYRSSH
jgi:hypothetical protein